MHLLIVLIFKKASYTIYNAKNDFLKPLSFKRRQQFSKIEALEIFKFCFVSTICLHKAQSQETILLLNLALSYHSSDVVPVRKEVPLVSLHYCESINPSKIPTQKLLL